MSDLTVRKLLIDLEAPFELRWNGGDAFTLFKDGSEAMVGPTDIEALTAWLVTGRALPAIGRVERINGN